MTVPPMEEGLQEGGWGAGRAGGKLVQLSRLLKVRVLLFQNRDT